MKINCITRDERPIVITVPVSMISESGEFTTKAIIDTGASVSLLSPAMITLLNLKPLNIQAGVHGLSGVEQKSFYSFDIKIGDRLFSDRDAIGLADQFLGHDVVIGLDIILETGLTLSPDGQYRLAA